MVSLRRTKAADGDLDDIFAYIAIDNLSAAERTIRRIETAEQRLREFPEIGRARADIDVGVRSWPTGDYVILYSLGEEGVLILRILHGSRDLRGMMNDV